RELRLDGGDARTHLPREPGQADLRREGAEAGARDGGRGRPSRAVTRVLFLTESFHPVLGGGEGHLRDLSRRLAASGMPATVVTRRGDRAWPARETLDGVRVVRVPPSGPARAGKYAMVPAALLALRR